MREMKYSGVEWIGDIPEDWMVMPNKYLMKKKKQICSHYNGEDIISLSMNGVIVRDLDAGGKMPLTFDGYQYIEKGNLLMCLFDIDVTPRCIGIIKCNGLTSPAYSQFVLTEKANAEYYNYYYTMLDNYKILVHLAKNLRHSLTEEQLGLISTIVPPILKQQAIADILDRKCTQIDALIANEEQQIAKLKAYKQSVITETVTKGLNPDVPMKDSGVEWIGEIPESWSIVPLKSLFFFKKGLPITKENLIENGTPVISYGQIHAKWNTGVTIHQELKRFVSETYITSNPNSIVKSGDFIMADTSEDLDGCGNCAYVDTDEILFAGYHTIVLSSYEKTNNKYLAYLFLTDAWRSQIRKSVTGVKLFSISRRILGKMSILLPNNPTEIVSFLDKKCEQIDRLIAIKQQKIEKIQQYKKSVIYEYVTGKREVST